MKRGKLLFQLTWFVLLVLFTFNCQAVFTTSAWEFMKPDASELPPEQLVEYTTDVLTNGTPEEVAEAFTAVQAALVNDAENGELNYAAANLALSVSGLSMDNLLTSISDSDALATLITNVDNNFDTLLDVGGYFQTADENDQELTANDSLFAGIALLADASGVTEIADFDGMDFSTPTPDQQVALDYILVGAADSDIVSGLLASMSIALP